MKIALIIIDDFSMYHFRGGLIKALVGRGDDVSVIVPPGNFTEKLKGLGIRVIPVEMYRFISPVHDLILTARLYKIFRSYRFDIVHNMTVKPNIYGSIAAKLAGIRRIVCLVSGRGFVFSGNSDWRAKILRWSVSFLYRIAMYLCDKTWFQNADDYEYFINKKIIKREKGVVIRSGGVNVNEYSLLAVNQDELNALRAELNIPSSAKCVMMVAARLVWSKGVKEFVEAAYQLYNKHPNWYFVMVCPRDENSPDSVPDKFFESYITKQIVIIDKFRYDIKEFIALADIMVLPSYYPEGVPRTLLEGLAMAKSIITTNHTGCRETVDEGENGYLIPVQNVEILADRLDTLMADEALRSRFGKHSRMKAEKEFSEHIVVSRIISEVYELSV